MPKMLTLVLMRGARAMLPRGSVKLAASIVTALACANAIASQPDTLRWREGDPGSTWVGVPLYPPAMKIRRGDVSVSVSLVERNERYHCQITVVNLGQEFTDVDPSRFTVVRKKHTVPSIPIAKLKIPEPKPLPSGLVVLAGLTGRDLSPKHKTATATIHNPDGTTSRVDIYEPGISEDEARGINANRRWNEWLDQNALVQRVLDPGRSAAGVVFFRRENNKQLPVVVRVPIGGIVYEFEIGARLQP